MPLTEIQAKILRTIARNRSPDSYLAGATVVHREDETPRFSQDLDFFHDLQERVSSSAVQDVETLRKAAYDVEWQLRTPHFHRALVSTSDEVLKLEWAQDSAFRFFPVIKDPFCGYRLHDADAATNKLLALAGRSEIRDLVDILHLDRRYLSLGAIAWAACGKDPGFTPDLILGQANQHTAYQPADLASLLLRRPITLPELKADWLESLAAARALVALLPPDHLGCLYVNKEGEPVTPASLEEAGSLHRHFGTPGGSWPSISNHSDSPVS